MRLSRRRIKVEPVLLGHGGSMSTEPAFEVRCGPVTVDVPKSVGYFGGITLAVSVGVLEPWLGLFIAAVPFLKILTHHALPTTVRAAGEIFEGAARPVGGDAEGTIRLDDRNRAEKEAIDILSKAELGGHLRTSSNKH
jgi:hypothetical protein